MNDDLGFVPDAPDDDLGFVADAPEQAQEGPGFFSQVGSQLLSQDATQLAEAYANEINDLRSYDTLPWYKRAKYPSDPAERDARINALIPELERWSANIAQYQSERPAPTPEQQRIAQAPTFGAALGEAAASPGAALGLIGPSAAASLVQAPQIVAAGLAAGPRGAALASGGMAAEQDYYGSLLSQLGDMGYDVSDNEILAQALQQADVLTKAQEAAGKRAAVVGATAGLGTALGGKMLGGFMAPGVGREVANVGVQIPAQAGVDMAGEALAQQASGEGYKPGEVVLEGLGGAVTAPVDVAQAAVAGFKEQGKPSPAPQDAAQRNAYLASLTEGVDPEGAPALVDAQGNVVGATLDEAKASVAAMSPEDIAGRMAPAAPVENVAPPQATEIVPEVAEMAQASGEMPAPAAQGATSTVDPNAAPANDVPAPASAQPITAATETPNAPSTSPLLRGKVRDAAAQTSETQSEQAPARGEPAAPVAAGRPGGAARLPDGSTGTQSAEGVGSGTNSGRVQGERDASGRVEREAQAGSPAPATVDAGRESDAALNENEWASFDEASGTLGIPRAEMPQVKAEHRGALVGYLKGQGVTHETTKVDAASLKPTQAEFSPAKVAKAKAYEGGDRSIIVSSDGHVVDGHHQWLAKRESGEPIKVIRLDKPIAEVLPLVRAFPSAEADAQTQPQRSSPMLRGKQDAIQNVERQSPSENVNATAPAEQDSVGGDVAQAPAEGAAQEQVEKPDAPLSLLQQRIADAKDGTFVPDGGNVTASVLAATGEDAPAAAYADGRLTGYAADAVEAMARLFGKKVVVFRETGRRKRDGFVAPASPGVIFLNADSPRPHVAVFMHELLHSLKRTDEKTYAKLEKALAPLLKDHARFKEARLGGKGSDALVQEEMMADVMGDQASDPKFWADLYGRFGDKSAWGQLVAYMRQMLSNVIDALYPLGSYQYVTDFNKAYEAVVDAAYNHARAQHGDLKTDEAPLDLPILSQSQGSPPSQSVLDEGNAAWRAGAVMWDNMNRMRIAQDKLVERGLKLRDDMNVWVRENLARSKMRVMADKVTDDFQTPILKAMKKAGLTLKQVDDFLYAKHAPERNREIAKINPKFPDGGSGMKNAEAARILAGFTPEQTRALDGIAKLVYDMQAYKLGVMEQNGLTEPSEIQALKAKYSNYVPLKTIEDDAVSSAPGGTGKGIEVSRSEYKAALGRGSRATSPLMVSFQDMARVLVRAHKNEAGNALLALARDPLTATMLDVKSGKPIIGIADPTDYMYDVKDAQGNVVGRQVRPNWWTDEEVFITKEGGVQRYIAVRDKELMSQLRRMGDADIGEVLQGIGGATRLFARMLTQYNPVFAPVNLIRDSIQASILALGVPGINPVKVALNIIPNLGRIMGHKLKPNQRYTEFLEDGGSTNAYGLRDLDDALAEVEAVGIDLGYASPRPLSPMQKGWRTTRKLGRRAASTKIGLGVVSARNVFQALAWYNEGFENAVRLSTYNAMRDAGISREQAAFQSKELSTNFNKKGQWSTVMNAAYVFVNAAMQGNRALLKFSKNPKVKAAIIGLVAAGVLQDLLGAALGGEDDESGLKNIDEVGDWALDHNIILITGEDTQKKIPLPYGLNLPFVIGRRVSKAIRTGDGFTQLTGILNVMLDNFSPIGGVEPVINSQTGKMNVAATIGKTATPSLARPIVAVATNSNFMGAPIARTPFQGDQTPAPRAYDAKPGTADYAIKMTQILNRMSGGDSVKPGDIDISPEHVEFLVGEYLGGAGRFASDLYDMAEKSMSGKEDEIDWTKAPFIRSFSGTDSRSDAYARFRQISTDAKYTKDQMEAREPVKPLDRGMLPVVEAADKRLKALRAERKAAYAREDMKRVRAIQDQEQAVIKGVVKTYEARSK